MKILPLAAIELLSLHNSLAQSKPVPRGVDNLKKAERLSKRIRSELRY